MKTGDEDTLNKFLSFGAPGIAFNQYDELYTTLDDSYDKESNGFRLPSYIAEGPAKLESYISLLGRKDEIVRKAAEGDADALYDLYQLIENQAAYC